MRGWFIGLLFCGFSGAAFAQVGEISLSLGQSRFNDANLGSSGGTSVQLGNGFRFALRLTINSWRFFGHEIGYAYNRAQFKTTNPSSQAGMAAHQGFYNFLVYPVPEGRAVRPFATGGGHFTNFCPPGASVQYGNCFMKFGFNYGGGIKLRAGSMFGVRFDIREYFTGKPFNLSNQSGLLHQLEVSAGFGVFF